MTRSKTFKKDRRVVKSISQLHEVLGYPEKPVHPLITLIDFNKVQVLESVNDRPTVLGFYCISLKKLDDAAFQYGRKEYDFTEASLLCMAPEQVTIISNVEGQAYPDGWGLYFHPDLIRKTFLNDKIKEYTFFSYDLDESLHLSDKEKQTLYSVVRTIEEEFSLNLDSHSHDLIVSNLEVLLNYCKRFYSRQFITRSHVNKGIVKRFKNILVDYYNSDELIENGMPSVKYCAKKLNLSPNYLGDLLKQETGINAIDHIHSYVIDLAKNRLVSSDDSVAEIAYDLGFGYPQSFSKLFKKKVHVSPKDYRSSN